MTRPNKYLNYILIDLTFENKKIVVIHKDKDILKRILFDLKRLYNSAKKDKMLHSYYFYVLSLLDFYEENYNIIYYETKKMPKKKYKYKDLDIFRFKTFIIR